MERFWKKLGKWEKRNFIIWCIIVPINSIALSGTSSTSFERWFLFFPLMFGVLVLAIFFLNRKKIMSRK
jgi:hypothetical protein